MPSIGRLRIISTCCPSRCCCHTLSVVSNNTIQEEKLSKTADNILKIKKYIDDHYTLPDLSLETICAEYQYNRKYLSEALKKVLHVGFSEYLRTLRIQHACMLVGEGLSQYQGYCRAVGLPGSPVFFQGFQVRDAALPKRLYRRYPGGRGRPGQPARPGSAVRIACGGADQDEKTESCGQRHDVKTL